MQKILDTKIDDQPPALLRLAFRPFFLLGAAFAVIAVLRWVIILQGWSTWKGSIPVFFWHAHEMIFGFVMAIILGFLLTAVQTWTSQPGIRGKLLGCLVACWCCARAVFWFNPNISWVYYWLPDFLLIISAGFFLARPILAQRQWRNLPFVPVLLIFAFLHSGFSLAFKAEHFTLAREFLMASFWLVVFLISMMGARVIPFFTARRWQSEQYKEPFFLSLLVPCVFLLVLMPDSLLNLAALPNPKSFAFFVLGIALSWRLYAWHHPNNWQEPLLWSLHVSYGAIALGCWILALSDSSSALNAHAVHLIALAGIGGIILAMIARVSLGHTGQPLTLAKAMPVAFALVFIAGLIRFLGPLFNDSASTVFYFLAGVLFSLGFLFYLWHYSALLGRPRKDGRPG